MYFTFSPTLNGGLFEGARLPRLSCCDTSSLLRVVYDSVMRMAHASVNRSVLVQHLVVIATENNALPIETETIVYRSGVVPSLELACVVHRAHFSVVRF